MNENKLIAAILTVAFYVGRGASMGLPQIVSTYKELRVLLGEEAPRKKRKKK